MRLSTVEIAGVRSPVVETGPSGAPEAVVFVHGNPGTGRDWQALMEPVGAFARAVALDMPGFGAADKPDGFPYTVRGYAEHLAGVLDELGVRRAHLVLHDFGGPWGLQWAVDHPDRHASTTLVNTGVPLREPWHAMAKVWRTPVAGELSFRLTTRLAMRQFLARTNPPGFPREYADHLFDLYRDPRTQRAVLRLYRATPLAEMAAGMAPPLRAEPRPTLVVWGAKDPYLKVHLAEVQRETFPEARVVILPDSGHWPMADAPAALADAVLPFLREQAGGAVD